MNFRHRDWEVIDAIIGPGGFIAPLPAGVLPTRSHHPAAAASAVQVEHEETVSTTESAQLSNRCFAYSLYGSSSKRALLSPSPGLTVDQLLGHRSIKAKKAPTNERLLRQLRQVEKLPPHARRSVLEHIDDLVAKYGSRG
jgi:hypothetical protein